MKLPRLSSTSGLAAFVNKAMDALDDAAGTTTDRPEPPSPPRGEDAPRWSEASVAPDSLYWLFPLSAATRIIAADESPVDDDADACSFTRMTLSRTRPADPVASVTGGGGDPVDGVGDAARYEVSSLGDGSAGWLSFATGDSVFEIMVLADDATEGGVPLDRMRSVTTEIARTVIGNLA